MPLNYTQFSEEHYKQVENFVCERQEVFYHETDDSNPSTEVRYDATCSVSNYIMNDKLALTHLFDLGGNNIRGVRKDS